ncbi:MAG: S8 family serine peptidase [Tahibacter sp.]
MRALMVSPFSATTLGFERAIARLAIAAVLLATVTAPAWSRPAAGWPPNASAANMIVVAVSDSPEPALGAGSSPRGYTNLSNYSGSDRALATAGAVARDFDLREVSAWTIEPLRLRCMAFEIKPDVDRAELLAQLQRDRRIRLAQPMHEFETLTAAAQTTGRDPADSSVPYNDPYIGLQQNLSSIHAVRAQQWTSGRDIEVAVIDTGLDAAHPDLLGRVKLQRDFIGHGSGSPATDRHGTQVAGVIAAVANNGVGIVGVAPQARISSYRACWPTSENAPTAHCNSYTLALAMGEALQSQARVINLSLGGPRDPLLEELVKLALHRGIVVVGAVPQDGSTDSFPIGVPGVIAVGSTGDVANPATILLAPGHDILTLEPGGHFDYTSGSSLAAAHVSGAVALLLALNPRLETGVLAAILSRSQSDAKSTIDTCKAVAELLAGKQVRAPKNATVHCDISDNG